MALTLKFLHPPTIPLTTLNLVHQLSFSLETKDLRQTIFFTHDQWMRTWSFLIVSPTDMYHLSMWIWIQWLEHMKVVILFRLWLVGSILRQSLGDSGDRIGLVEVDMIHHTNYNNPFLSQNHYPYFLRLIDQWLINSNKFDLLMKVSYATNGYTMYVLVAFIYKAQPYFFAMTLKTKINNS